MFTTMTNLSVTKELLTMCFVTCIFRINLEVWPDQFYIDLNAQKQYLKEINSQGSICLTGKEMCI